MNKNLSAQTKDLAERILIQLPHCAVVYEKLFQISQYEVATHLLTQLISSIWISHHPRILLVGQYDAQIKSKNIVVSACDCLDDMI